MLPRGNILEHISTAAINPYRHGDRTRLHILRGVEHEHPASGSGARSREILKRNELALAA
jgi:hypothetical protein